MGGYDDDDDDGGGDLKPAASSPSMSTSDEQQQRQLNDNNEEGDSDGEEDGNESEEEEEVEDDDESSDDDDDLSDDDEDEDGDGKDNINRGGASSSDSEDDGLSEYERLRLERIARNQARLRQLGFDEPKEEKKKKKKTPAKPRKSELTSDGPRRQLPGRAKRATFNESSFVAAAKKERREEEEKNMDACYTCQKEEGELRSCDYCRRLYHIDCHVPPISPNDTEFKCSVCEAEGKSRRVACGKCSGCKREEDCMTCISCVAKYEKGDTKRSKCIFRKCQSWGKATLIRANTDDTANDDDDEEDYHDADCHVCREGGDLICCDGCTKVYHAYCHKPKLDKLPDGDWYCMVCCQTKKAAAKPPKEKKKKYSGQLIADLGHCDMQCTVRFPKMECIVCEEVEVTGPKKSTEWTTCRACDDSYHLQCLNPPLEVRPNNWRCPSCKERKIKVKKEEKESKPLFKGEHNDDCFMCFNGGDLLCCDYCEKAFHLQCHIPPLHEIPTGLWKCQECAAVEYKRKMKCGECNACLRDDCGKCVACLDKPKFGGPSRLKQGCEKKKCPFMRFAPPTKVGATPKSILKKKKKEKKRKRMEKVDDDNVSNLEEEMTADAQDGAPARKKGRHLKRQKSEQMTGDEAELKSPPESAAEALAIAKAKEQAEAIDKIIHNKPLKNDPVGNKIRQIIVKSLKNPDNFKLQDRACEALRLMSTSDENVAAKIILLGGITMINTAMKNHPDKTIVQAESCALLSELAWINPSCSTAIVEEGCLELVLKSIERHSTHPKLQQMAVGFFRALSYDFANHQIIDRVNGVSAIIDAMKRNARKYDILKEGCYFLQNILCNPEITEETIQLFESKGAIPIILNPMNNCKSEEGEYLGAACGVLANLAINEDARTYIGGYESTIPTLLSILGPDLSLDACKCSLTCLKLLAMRNEENKAKIVALEGMSLLCNILLVTNDSALADAGLRLLAELTKNNTTNSQLLKDAGGFDLVKTAMSGHVHSPYIQASCCSVLRNLPTEIDEARDMNVLVLAAMKKHREDKLVQFEGCHLLLQYSICFPTIANLIRSKSITSISSNVRSSKRKLRASKHQKVVEKETKSDEPMQEAEQNGGDDTQCTESAIEQVQVDELSIQVDSIIKGKPLKDDPVGNKIRLIIVKALKHPLDSKMQDKACEVLRFLAKSDVNASKIIDLGALTMISKAIKDHPDKTIVHAEASALLAELSWINPSCIGKIVEHGCLQLVLKSIERHSTHLKVNQMGLGFFRALSYDFVNHPSIESVNGVSSIIDAMTRNAKKYVIMKEGCYFLQNILCNPDISMETIELIVSKDIALTIIDSISISDDKYDAEYLEAACGVLANLAIDNTAREQIGGYESSIPALLSVFGHGVTSDAACKCSLNALKLLAAGNDDIKFKIAHLGGIKTVSDFLLPPNAVILSDAGLGLLSELAKDNERNAQMLLDTGCFVLVTSEMTNHSDSSHLQARACEVLCNLPISNTDEVDAAVKLILSAMKNHKDSSLVQYEGAQALLKFCWTYPSTAEILKSEEATASILAESQYMTVNYGALS